MISVIKELLENSKPKIPNIDEHDAKMYKVGLSILGCWVSEDFIDIPKLPENRFDTDGLFYTIPYFDDDMLYTNGNNQYMLMVLWKIEKRSSFCPLRIDLKFVDRNNFAIYVYDQSGQRTEKKELVSCEDGQYFSHYDEPQKLKLSELFKSDFVQEQIRQKK